MFFLLYVQYALVFFGRTLVYMFLYFTCSALLVVAGVSYSIRFYDTIELLVWLLLIQGAEGPLDVARVQDARLEAKL